MALTKTPIELSSTPSIVDGGNATAITISSAELVTVANGLTLTDGNVVVANGHGIDFSATGNISGTSSELLADYEEGTWTPTDASGEGYSLTVNSATYTKIGRLVYITVYIDYPAQSSSAGQLNGGLPFTSMSGNTFPQLAARVIDDTVSANNLTFQVSSNSTEGGVLDGAARITNAQLSGKAVLYTGCYQTA